MENVLVCYSKNATSFYYELFLAKFQATKLVEFCYLSRMVWLWNFHRSSKYQHKIQIEVKYSNFSIYD